ncbi:MAG TPA: hypothetical protein VLU41_05090, partial [Ideonella sp.]|nr:hypothetical protein [Ideonella sp.]
LGRIMHTTAAVMPDRTDVAIQAELDRAHQALGRYVQARMHGNRKRMRAAAADAVEALTRADSIAGAERPQ